MQDNQFNSETHIVLDADGGAKAKVKILCTGDYRFNYIGYSSMKLDDQKEMLMHELNVKQPSVFDISSPSDKNGVKKWT